MRVTGNVPPAIDAFVAARHVLAQGRRTMEQDFAIGDIYEEIRSGERWVVAAVGDPGRVLCLSRDQTGMLSTLARFVAAGDVRRVARAVSDQLIRAIRSTPGCGLDGSDVIEVMRRIASERDEARNRLREAESERDRAESETASVLSLFACIGPDIADAAVVSTLVARIATLEAELCDLRALERRVITERAGRAVPDTVVVGIDLMDEA